MLLHRLFFALLPPFVQRNLIAVHRDAFPGATSLVANDRLHKTLAIAGDFERFPKAVAEAMLAIGAAVALGPFAVRLDRLSGSNRSIALRPSRRSAGLAELSRQLAEPLRRHGLARDGWSFSPHVTLLYRNGAPFQQPIEPIGWDATDFVLIHSVVGATRHVELGRWRLESRQGAFGF
ncbi:2'-5' RNA ligase family protein [Sphingomonas sp.]|uniref:2'-5' RNA ligase family protein n=1 Tax=Sphingomonas sp. TaxID=28214 RepID=UPI001B21D782|nr:2'-5' RNA ligase family protein [Sphingomonas sp.]MBO9714708.1 2'-5' RNA ligase family protein [Sphingomonas sp.]